MSSTKTQNQGYFIWVSRLVAAQEMLKINKLENAAPWMKGCWFEVHPDLHTPGPAAMIASTVSLQWKTGQLTGPLQGEN